MWREKVKNRGLFGKMKKKFLTHRTATIALSIAFIFLTSSCIRTENCEYGIKGYLIYLSNPHVTDNGVIVRAYFVPQQPDLNIDSLSVVLKNSTDGYIRNLVHPIRGNIPSEFTQEIDTPIPVICELDPRRYIPSGTAPIKIVCIEKI